MAKIFSYFDENIQTALADALSMRGIDALTTHKAGNVCAEDLHQAAYAAEKGRTILSYNIRDFALLHYQWMRIGRSHAGAYHSFRSGSYWGNPSPTDEASLLREHGGYEEQVGVSGLLEVISNNVR